MRWRNGSEPYMAYCVYSIQATVKPFPFEVCTLSTLKLNVVDPQISVQRSKLQEFGLKLFVHTTLCDEGGEMKGVVRFGRIF